MRPETSAPAHVGRARSQLHTHVLRTERRTHWTPRNDWEAVGEFIKSAVANRVPGHLKHADLSVLWAMLAHVHGGHFSATGQMFCWPGEVALTEATGLSATGIYRAIRRLVDLALVERATVDVDGYSHQGYVLNKPEMPLAWSKRRRSVRAARGIVGKYARAPRGARTEGPARAPEGARAQPAGRAQDTVVSTTSTRASETPMNETRMSSSSSTPPVVPEPAPDGRGAAAAAELEALGIGAETVRELAALPTTTRAVAIAAGMEAARKPEDKRTGLIVHLVRHPERIAAKNLRAANARLTRAAPRGSEMSSLPPGHAPADPRVGAAVLKAALEKAKAGG